MADPKAPQPPHRGDDYWSLARQPLHCLLFLLPLLAAYEIGVALTLGGDQASARNGADYWMRSAMNRLGFNHPLLLPVVVVGLLVTWQFVGRFRWKPSAGTLFGMLAESALFGACLVVLGQLQDLVFQSQPGQLANGPHAGILLSQPATLPRVISYLGAGVYEEVLFRLCLIPVSYALLRALSMPRSAAMLVAVLTTSILFSAAHYVGPAADQLSLFSFVFRATAGMFFALLFVLRGFGITVGSHAAYDLIVGILLPTMGV
jgi:hypothetical protein